MTFFNHGPLRCRLRIVRSEQSSFDVDSMLWIQSEGVFGCAAAVELLMCDLGGYEYSICLWGIRSGYLYFPRSQASQKMVHYYSIKMVRLAQLAVSVV